MKFVVDTCSLISLVRYYLPFDNDRLLYDYVKNKVDSGELLILDKVVEECKYSAKGIVLDTLKYIEAKASCISTESLYPTKGLYNLLENNFINKVQREKISDPEFEIMKNDFLNSGDGKMIMYFMNNRQGNVVIVTEESESPNDNKTFKKLPSICKIIDCEVINLPSWIQRCNGIDIKYIN